MPGPVNGEQGVPTSVPNYKKQLSAVFEPSDGETRFSRLNTHLYITQMFYAVGIREFSEEETVAFVT